MAKRTGPSNYQLQQLVDKLRPVAIKNRFWKRVLEEVLAPSRNHRIVNLYKINQFANEGEMIFVPGKVLSVGELTKKVEVAAINFSTGAREKILAAKGKTMNIEELLKKNPEAKNMRILG